MSESSTESKEKQEPWFPGDGYRRTFWGARHVVAVYYSSGQWFFEATPMLSWIFRGYVTFRSEMSEAEVERFKSIKSLFHAPNKGDPSIIYIILIVH
jgi:hypothetical protein